MKKVFITACTVALVGLCSFVQAQDADTTTANDHYKKGLEKTGDKVEEGADKAGTELRQGAEKTEEAVDQGADKAREGYQETKQDVKENADDAKQAADEKSDEAGDKASQLSNTAGAQIKDEKVEAKVGPNDEPIFINENAEYYYVDKEGKKVVVKESELKDKPDNK